MSIEYRYEFRDFEGEYTSFGKLDNKAFWCNHGENQENAFVEIYKELQQKNIILDDSKIAIHPQKDQNAYHPDLEINGQFVGELKTKNSPLFIAEKYGVHPQYALTMDLKDSFNYQRLLQKNIDVCIYIWVKWEAKSMQRFKTENNIERKIQQKKVKEMGGIWRVNFSTLRNYEIQYPPNIHWYKENYRKPIEFDLNDTNHQKWIEELREFEPRLIEGNKFKNITAQGYFTKAGIQYTKGHSSGSYVFDLSNRELFECLYFKMK